MALLQDFAHKAATGITSGIGELLGSLINNSNLTEGLKTATGQLQSINNKMPINWGQKAVVSMGKKAITPVPTDKSKVLLKNQTLGGNDSPPLLSLKNTPPSSPPPPANTPLTAQQAQSNVDNVKPGFDINGNPIVGYQPPVGDNAFKQYLPDNISNQGNIQAVTSTTTPPPTPANPSSDDLKAIIQAEISKSNQTAQQKAAYDATMAKSAAPSADYINQQANANAYNEALKKSIFNESNDLVNNSMNPVSLNTQQGRGAIIQNQALQQQNALSGAYQGAANLLGQANTQQQNQIQGNTAAGNLANISQAQQLQGLNNAAQSAAPIQVAPGTSVINPTNMKEGYSGLGGLTGLGIAQQNIKQGQQYAQQSSDLGAALQGINSVSKLADDFLGKSGLNQSSSPFFNQQQNTTLGQLKAGDIGSYNELVNQIQTYANQIFQSTGMTPTDAGNLAKGISVDGMTQGDLKGFLTNLDTMGNARKAILDSMSKGSYASGTTPYTGNPATTGGSLQTTNSGAPIIPSGDAALQAIAGGAANFGGDIATMGAAIWKFLGI